MQHLEYVQIFHSKITVTQTAHYMHFGACYLNISELSFLNGRTLILLENVNILQNRFFC